MSNLSQTVCLSNAQMSLSNSHTELILTGYVVPFLILFGFTGNMINLTILVAPGMKSRSNFLLACLAVVDMLFLISMLPHSFAHYQVFIFSYYFRVFYLKSKTHAVAFSNWFSAAAIWLVLAICLERLIGIRYPLSVRYHRIYRPQWIVTGIIILSFILTLYSHFTYSCFYKEFCHGTQPYSICLPISLDKWPYPTFVNTSPNFQRIYVRWSLNIHAIFGVFLPTVVVVFSNALLIYTMRQRQKFLAVSTGYVAGRGNNAINQSTAQMRVEQRVTLTVCAIVSCFIITQAPSALFYLIAGDIQAKSSNWHGILSVVTSFMVIFGKSLNFVLFCLSSATFRHRLVGMTKARIGGKRNFSLYRRHSQEMNTQITALNTAYPSRKNSEHSALCSTSKGRNRTQSLNADLSSSPILKGPNTVQGVIRKKGGTLL
uniref:G-protein coupled receptors family 1 profile domain-containing protein n=1 Tax=Panagrolaimus sp. JU765 TaxID=591449 RepID=A0AC34QHV6_9BILA